MEKYLNMASGFIPLWAIGIISALILGVITIFIIIVISRKRFNNLLKQVMQHPELSESLILKRYSSAKLLRRSKLIEKFAHKNGNEIIGYTKIDDLWLKRLMAKRREQDFKRIMNYARAKGIFTCFIVSLDNKKLSSLFMRILNVSEGFLSLRKLALAGNGEDFNGEKALLLFKDKLDELREMTGYPEWQARYFAVKILLHDNDEKSVRAIRESFKDSYPLIRRTAASEFKTGEKEKLYSTLYNLILNDPSPEVRSAAWKRIQNDFKDLYILKYEKLKGSQLLHALEVLQPSSKNDENTALNMLRDKNPEISFYAAQFLKRAGSLNRLLIETDMGDMDLVERNLELLKKAVEVHEISFLSYIKSADKPAPLYIGAKILADAGPRDFITELARKIFELPDNGPEYFTVYDAVLDAVRNRGTDKALFLMHEELKKRQNNHERLIRILNRIPARADFIFIDTLFSLLENPRFKEHQSLRRVFGTIAADTYIDRLMEIIRGGREKYPHKVRIEALKILGETGKTGCLQIILENLPVLPLDEAKAFTKTLHEYSGENFNRKAAELLDNVDSTIRASLIAALPATGSKEFIKEIRNSLNDSDPDVRIACAWALADFGDYRSLNQALDMLRDPVERVREEAARVIGSVGQKEAVSGLKKILTDKNEVLSVKESAVNGLARSSSLESINILIDAVESDKSLRDPVIRALSFKRKEKEIKSLIEHFKDAGPELKDIITETFKKMGETIEAPLSELMRQDIASLHQYIVEILEKTGYVDAEIRKLANRDVNVRKRAASFLSLVGSLSAFRGIVLASRDPNIEVRVEVVKALEKLETEDGEKILNSLKDDPDKKVRTYTLWAMERLKAKSL
ncbi:MAG: HEAT repeat domain-containing protein [Spirochaetes bacterium]|nr:HEAT repeat domain-containing protein [Spirochaetota bacterium]